MNQVNSPDVMSNAREDLLGNVSGHFAPEDWVQILTEARRRLDDLVGRGTPATEAWPRVVAEFTRERYWGFTPGRRPVRAPKAKPARKSIVPLFVWLVFSTMTITNIAVVWSGQNYTISDDPKARYYFLVVLALVVANFAFFLWRTRHHRD